MDGLIFVAHCDRDENVKGVWRFGSAHPGAYYPSSQQGQIDEEWGRILVADATGSESTAQDVVESLTHSSVMEDRWFVIDNSEGLPLPEVFDANSAR